MPKILGIIGGGQLGMMLAEAAAKMPEHISKVVVLDPTMDCPAARVGAEQIIADFKDKNAIVELSLKSDIITYEIESGNSEVLESLKAPVSVNPSPATLRTIQDKFTQKTFLRQNEIPVPEFLPIDSLEDLRHAIRSFGYPVLLKARRDAYDGRGNFKIKSEDQIEQAYNLFKGRPMMVERWVDFEMEVSVIAARNTMGEIATYPVVENIHRENILEMTIAPARVDAKIASDADTIARKTMQVLHGAGVFGIEMFVTRDSTVMINEIAPRVHNSGHHTLESSDTSQFEQHLRAILGLPLGSTRLNHFAVMRNILGPKGFAGRYRPIALDGSSGVYLKMYNKDEAKPQRKLGHINVIDLDDKKDIDALIATAEKARESIRFEPLP